MQETRTSGTDPSPAELTRYIYSNHLQSASLELNEDAAIISYEEYHPYGTTAYQAMNVSINAVAKRYRYTGKERDEESGLYYHGARYYIPWLGRWSACDPLENKYAGMSPYNYAFCNPVVWNDLSGMNPRIPPPKSPKESEGALATFISEIYDHNKTLIHYERVDLFIPIENLPKDSSNRGVFLSKTYLGNSKQSNREIEMKVSTNEFRTEYSFQSYDFRHTSKNWGVAYFCNKKKHWIIQD